jgi:hypothetical protein
MLRAFHAIEQEREGKANVPLGLGNKTYLLLQNAKDILNGNSVLAPIADRRQIRTRIADYVRVRAW